MDNLTPTQIILVRLLCFLIPVGVLMLGPKDALLRRLWTGKTPRMWHLETIAVMICVALVILLFGNSPVEWVGFAALSLAHGRNSIMFRLSEGQEKSTSLDPHHVECGRWIPVYFFGSELCWATYFLLHRSWAALAGVAIFVSYGQWRRWYAKWRKQAGFRELIIDPKKIAPVQVRVKVGASTRFTPSALMAAQGEDLKNFTGASRGLSETDDAFRARIWKAWGGIMHASPSAAAECGCGGREGICLAKPRA